MATQKTKTVEHNDPARILIRLSAVLTVIMAVAAGVLTWRSRNDASAPGGESDSSVATTDGDMPAYSFKVNPPGTKPSTGMADVVADFEFLPCS